MTLKTMLTAAAFSAAISPLAPVVAQPSDAPATKAVQGLMDELELQRIPTEVEIAVDRKDWSKARSYFAEMVRVDFTSLVGGEPATIPSDGLMQGWSGNLKGNKESLHMRSHALVAVNGDWATVYSNGYAYNRMPGAPDGSGDLWEVWGTYVHELNRTAQGWKIVGFTFRKTYERGSNWVKITPGS
jgi:SnoaL-like domain